MPEIRVQSLFVYPLKSGAAFERDHLTFDRLGPVGDRRWMAVDLSGQFITQREAPRLATVRASFDELGRLRLEAPDLEPYSHFEAQSRETQATIWKSTLDALDIGDRAAEWLSEALGTSCRIVRAGPSHQRPVDPARTSQDDIHMSYVDSAPILAISEASLVELNSRLDTPVPMDRFRPNIVIEGADAFAEDGWAGLRIGEAEFRFVKRCPRCKIVTLDQRTGESHGAEPLKTLASYRRDGTKVMFGAYFTPTVAQSPAIRVGDVITPL